MKAASIALVVLLPAWSTPVRGEGPDLRLELETALRTLRAGQETTLKMRIVGGSISRLTEASEGVILASSRVGAFVYEFRVKPPREGKFTFGPYRLSFDGQNLTSNCVSIQVLPPWDGRYGTFFRVDSNNITLGEAVELVMETWSKEYSPVTCSPKRDDKAFAYDATAGTASSMVSGTSGKGVSLFYSCSRWLITPRKAGEFRITSDFFRDFPESADPPDIVVKVKEITPPADATERKLPQEPAERSDYVRRLGGQANESPRQEKR